MRSVLFLTCAVRAGLLLAQVPGLSDLPPGTRGWECVPGVVRNDGSESFCVEVFTGGAVSSVTLDLVAPELVPPSPGPIELRDDGEYPDRVTGDFVYTAGPFRCRRGAPACAYYMDDMTSPAGLDTIAVGQVSIVAGDLTETFLVGPSVGVLRADVPAVITRQVADNLAVSPHLVNVRTRNWASQGLLRQAGPGPAGITQTIYRHLPDRYDFLVFFTTNRLEQVPSTASENFVAGRHVSVRVDFTGTGRPVMNAGSIFGSPDRLLGIVLLDAYERGIYGANVTHELLHTWGGWLDTELGLTDASKHYLPRSSVGSLLGGQRWFDRGDGTFSLDCSEGRNGARQASPLDLYLMGLIDASELAPLRVYSASSPLPLFRCDDVIADVARTVTASDIIARHGPRVPGPEAARRHFNIAFIADSRDRLLTPTEMTFYDLLAAHYARPVPAGLPAPHVGFNWPPVTRFFGAGVTWSTAVMPGDLDWDGTVGEQDFEIFAACAGGPGVDYRQFFPEGCPLLPDAGGYLPADFDADGDVDQTDFGVMQRMGG
ncbi:MAG TPA: hypothetical protein PL151_14475 [Phycisphaerae bacterium]|nr:hypothetical protein [Phycisphaerae bacterium]HQE28962.1 hypothetical protein [Phycisphaerae bacterium]